MNLVDYMRILARRGWIILLVAALAATSAFIFSKLQTPVYRSIQRILIQPSRNDFGLTEATTRLLRSYVAWMDSNYRAQAVIDALQLDTTPAELRRNVRIAADESRLVIEVEVEDTNGDRANDIAREWGVLLVQWRNEQNQRVRREDRIEAELIDDPVYGLAWPKTGINTIAGAILGALIGGVIVFVLEYLESGIVRSPDDVERFVGLRVIGAIPEWRAAE